MVGTLCSLCVESLREWLGEGRPLQDLLRGQRDSKLVRLGSGDSESLFKAVTKEKNGRRRVDKALRKSFGVEGAKEMPSSWVTWKTLEEVLRGQRRSLQVIDLMRREKSLENTLEVLIKEDMEELKVLKLSGESGGRLPWGEIKVPGLVTFELEMVHECGSFWKVINRLSRMNRLELLFRKSEKSLRSLSLMGNLEGVKGGIGSFRNLEVLRLHEVSIGRKLFGEIRQLENLTYLDLSVIPEGSAGKKDSKLLTCDEMESLVESLSKLEHLDISGRRFADALPPPKTSIDTTKQSKLQFLGVYKTQWESHWKDHFHGSAIVAGTSSGLVHLIEINAERFGMLQESLTTLTSNPGILENLTGEESERFVTLLVSKVLGNCLLATPTSLELLRLSLKSIFLLSQSFDNPPRRFLWSFPSHLMIPKTLLKILVELLSEKHFSTHLNVLYNVFRILYHCFDLPKDLLDLQCLERFSKAFLHLDKGNLRQSECCLRLYAGILEKLATITRGRDTESLEILNDAGFIRESIEIFQAIHFSHGSGIREIRQSVWNSLGTFIVEISKTKDNLSAITEFLCLHGLNWLYGFAKENLPVSEMTQVIANIVETVKEFLQQGPIELKSDRRKFPKWQRCLKDLNRMLPKFTASRHGGQLTC